MISTSNENNGYVIYTKCDLCGNYNLERLIWRPYRYKGEVLYHVKCRRCGLIFTNPRPTTKANIEIYNKDYSESKYIFGVNGGIASNEEERRNTAKGILRLIKKYKNNGRILDVGCSAGYFLDEARNEGFIPYGVELSEYTGNIAKNKFNLEIHIGEIFDSPFQNDFFDVIHLGEILEHVPPSNFLNKCYELLKPRGIIIITCPSISSIYTYFMIYLTEIYYWITGTKNKIDNEKFRMTAIHIFEYTPRTLQKLLDKCNFKMLKMISREDLPFLMKNKPDDWQMKTLKNIIAFPVKVFLKIVSYFLSLFTLNGNRLIAIAKKPEAGDLENS